MTQLKERGCQPRSREEHSLSASTVIARWQDMAGTSRVNREVYARFCGRLEVKSLRPTRRRYLYRAIDRNGALVDVMFSEHRDMAAAKAFFQSAKTVTDVIPDRVTTDGHDSYPRAIRTKLGEGVKHRTSRYLNNRLEQDHRGIKGRYQPMRGFKCPRSADRFCRGYDELRNLLRPRSRPHQQTSANTRRLQFLRRTATVMALLEAA